MALTVNRRNGVLVSGHQRLYLLDEDAKGADYSIDVDVIDVDEAEEKALNVAFNNLALMGSYDFDKLQGMLAEGVDAKLAGFDALDMKAMFPEADVSGMFDAAKDEAARKPLKSLKEMKQKAEKTNGEEGDNNAGFYCTLVGDNAAQVTRFLKAVGLPEGEKFHDLERFAKLMGIDLGETK